MSFKQDNNNKIQRRLIVLYNILLFIVILLGFPLIVPIILLTDKRRHTVLQRLGLAEVPSARLQNRRFYPSQKPIWIHALSVGEVLSAVPLVKKISDRFEDRKVFVSVSTRTGFKIANQEFGQIAEAVFYYPYDIRFSVKRIVAKVDPALVVIVESDVWPNFLFELQHRKVPVVLVNARLSQRSFVGYNRVKFFSKSLFLFFVHICAQSLKDAERLMALGVPSNRITVVGNIKFDQEYNPLPNEKMKKLRQRLNVHPSHKIFLAGSTHKGEEEVLLEAFVRLKKKNNDLLLIVVPRNPERADSVLRLFQSAGLATVLLTALNQTAPAAEYSVIVVDIIGVLKEMYAIADVTFVGGSLVRCGGHNPLEPAIFAKPIIFGPDMSDFAEISNMLLAAGGAERVQDAESLYHVASRLFEDQLKAKEIGKSAFKVFSDNKGAVEKTLKVIEESF